MCELAVEGSNDLMVDSWESRQPEFIRTARVLQHFDLLLNGNDVEGGCVKPDGTLSTSSLTYY